jgi:hypothetical protein
LRYPRVLSPRLQLQRLVVGPETKPLREAHSIRLRAIDASSDDVPDRRDGATSIRDIAQGIRS